MVTWWRESVLLDDTFDVSPLGIVRNELELASLQRHDLMAVYTCQASNNNFSDPISTSVTVDMNYRPMKAEIEGEKRPLSAGRSVELVCRVTGSRPPAAVSWWLEKRQLKQSTESVSIDGYVTTSTLRFTPTREDHGTNVVCRAHNTYIPASSIQDSWLLEVYYQPYVNLRLGNKIHHSQIYEGSDVFFECNVVSNPPAKEIQWKFNDKELKANSTRGIIIANNSLVLKKIRRKNKGSYKCLAINSEGQGESNAIYLRIQYAPFCKPSQKIIYGAARHEAIKVICEVEADPSEVTFRWEFNNTVENLEVVNFRTEGTISIATYILRTQYDYGTLLCWGTNEVGKQREPCVYTVVPAGPPDPVENCSVTNQTDNTVAIQCNAGYNGGLQQHFVLEIHDTIIHRLLVNITADVPWFYVRDLPSDTPLILVIYAVNNKGKSKSLVIKTYTLASQRRDDDTDSWRLGFSPVMIILCSVVTSLALVAFLIIIIVKCKTDYYLKVNTVKRRHSEKEPQEDHQLRLRPSLADEKCPDVIPDYKIQNSEEKLLENNLLQTEFTSNQMPEIKIEDEDKDTYHFVHSPTNSIEYPQGTKQMKVPISRIRQCIEKLQTEV
ncbi:nephrin-like [Centruroides sculpturatus]|uniref:nephrin-like n=1 Tax=Centruroides sculpturatus TaxID=218467 RepID=UPI000C6DE060|nr:nephrin-like [Centruroides sculpturatus]